MHAVGELADGARERHRDDAEHGKADARDEESRHGGHRVDAGLQSQERRQDEVARPEEHREEGHAHEQALTRAETPGKGRGGSSGDGSLGHAASCVRIVSHSAPIAETGLENGFSQP